MTMSCQVPPTGFCVSGASLTRAEGKGDRKTGRARAGTRGRGRGKEGEGERERGREREREREEGSTPPDSASPYLHQVLGAGV